MVRKLALAVSLALGTLSVPVHALGLGELTSKSALNQNFNGDITLLSVRPEELDAVRVKLADAEAFQRAGVERPFYLSLLKFEPTLTRNGKSVIRITSEFPIREPFMNFLVEVNWPNGRMLREYTVLLDPPTTTRRRPPKVAPAVKKSKPAPAAVAAPAPKPAKKAAAPAPTPAPAPAPSTASEGYEYGPVVANDTAWGISKKVRPAGVSMEQMMMALLAANQHAFVNNNINRLRKGKILRVPSLAEIKEISRQQARQAYRQQQDEWLARRNEKLQSEAATAAPEEASAAAGTAAPEASDQLRIATARPEGEGEAGAGDDDALSPTSSDLKSRLIVARENAETSRQEAETLRSQVDDLQGRLENMQKLLSLKDDQLAQFQDRIATEETETAAADAAEPQPAEAEAAVEAAMEDAQAVVEETAEAVAEDAQAVVEETTAAMVDDAKPTLQPVEPPGVATAEPVDEDYRIADIAPQVDPDRIVMGGDAEPEVSGIQDIAPQVDPDLIVEQAAAELAAPETPAEEEIVVGDATGETEIVIEGDTAAEPVAEAPADAAAQPEPAAAPEPAVAEQPVETPAEPAPAARPDPMMKMIEDNLLPIAAGGVSLLALLGWLFTRGRRNKEESPEPALAPAAAEMADAPVEEAELPEVVDQPVDSGAINELPDSSFLDEFSPSDINALQDETGEVDPVSEADVYIAYGRYQQAEEMLQQAMGRDPERLALKHKLLEVHYATRNAGAFATLAQQMVDAGQDTADEAAWSRAKDMGRELAPDNSLFNPNEVDGTVTGLDEDVGTADQVVEAPAKAAPVDDDTLSLDELELSELSEDFDDTRSVDDLEAPSEVSITLDLEEPSNLSESVPEVEVPESISLDDLDVELPKAEVDETPMELEDTIADSLDLDSMMADAEAAVDMEDTTLSLEESEFTADDLQAQLDELSDLSLLDSETVEAPAVPEPPAGMGLVEEDAGSTEKGLDEPLNLDVAFEDAQGDDASADVVDIGVASAPAAEPVGEDEVATKLDLARAYVEMGDEDGARAILEEVLAEGSQTQRGDAENLLEKLG